MSRPASMRIDDDRCIECGLCEGIAPGIRLDPNDVRPSNQTLDAMAECPTGAIVWREEGVGKSRP